MFEIIKLRYGHLSEKDLHIMELVKLDFIISKIAIFMGQFEDFSAALDSLDTGITGVATTLAGLASQPKGGLTADQEAQLLARIQGESDKLSALTVPAAPAAPVTPAAPADPSAPAAAGA